MRPVYITRPVRMNPVTGLLLVLYHALALTAFALPMPSRLVVAGVVVYLLVGLGTTLGLHRKLTHRSFECPKWVEYTLATLAMLPLQTSPLPWVANHRIHHAHTDRDGDPHSPRWGFLYSYLGWVIDDLSTDREAYRTHCRDLADDRYYQWLLRYRGVPHVIALVAIVAIAGWRAAPCVLYLPLNCWMSAQYFVNSVCHSEGFGFRSFETTDATRNVWLIGLVGLGEGWHNNHHARPRWAQLGQGPWQIDIGGLVLRIMCKLGLASQPRGMTGSKRTPNEK